ncbi:TetR/AcrR family transcriptional regulator [Streptomyces europaeiscabiei]|uniref:TetR family transcriptional regulator n=1 Tax=Streptomyces europaeiscabiei TaxID=146819 RepID=A0ABU4NZS9_9ACTN|nr:TetR family transcriptional regulator [Streptomyces europaeiscabiei]MDX2531471.1 TetR family transcriptional regulator [Streptomyces europaeiscabiei]MDX2763769.1 TetR family transcriptional regulator [Streptomyces europaeiscabiei]MDX2773217.1 TetR family transcriptional regulator [Streptomyces europaeiscabiei]MDX3550057.1 TetR family transcriptional regulator [Streptomyces europaeiscabiei]MDX3559295.1 TetR family transcriptional regulator [Streptomyces europaeiscabiei]
MTANKDRVNTRTFTQNARRAQIVQAAIETLAETGYAKTSFNRISQQAKLSSTGMISYHFSGKPELFAEVAHTVVVKADNLAAACMEDENTYRGKLTAYIRSNFDFIARYPLYARALTEIVGMIRDRHITGMDDVERSIMSVEQLVTLLEQGRRAGEFGSFDCFTMALVIRGAIDGIVCQHLRVVAMDLDRCAREVSNAFVRCTQPA